MMRENPATRRLSAVAILSLAGLGVTTYLSITYLTDIGLACGPAGDCEVVASSRYASLFGVPVPLFGVVMYAALLAGSLWALVIEDLPPRLAAALAGVSGVGTAFSAYLTSMSVFVLRATCPYCLASAAAVTAIFVLALSAWVTRRGGREVSALSTGDELAQAAPSPGTR